MSHLDGSGNDIANISVTAHRVRGESASKLRSDVTVLMAAEGYVVITERTTFTLKI